MPEWVKLMLDDWLGVADIRQGKLFRCVCRKGTVWGTEVTEKVVWHVVKEYAGRLGISKLAPHDLRRSCARFCHDSGGELEQIHSCSATFRSRPPRNILGANNDSAKPSMID